MFWGYIRILAKNSPETNARLSNAFVVLKKPNSIYPLESASQGRHSLSTIKFIARYVKYRDDR